MALLPKDGVDDAYPLAMFCEFHPTQFAEPAVRARERAQGPELGLCQFFHRRAILRGGSAYFEAMVNAEEADFVATLASIIGR